MIEVRESKDYARLKCHKESCLVHMDTSLTRCTLGPTQLLNSCWGLVGFDFTVFYRNIFAHGFRFGFGGWLGNANEGGVGNRGFGDREVRWDAFDSIQSTQECDEAKECDGRA